MRAFGGAIGVSLLGACAALAACGGTPTSGSFGGSQDATADGSSSGDTDATVVDAPEGDPAETGASDAGSDSDADVGSSEAGPFDATLGDAGDGSTADATRAEAGDGSVTEAAPDAPIDAPSEASEGASDASPDATADGPRDAPGDSIADASDGSPEEAGETGPPSLCAQEAYLFCDGFEQSILTNWAAISTTGGQAGLDSTHVYRGRRALHANTYAILEAGTSESAYVMKYGATPWPTHFFTRMFVYMPSPPPTFTFNILDLQQNGGSYTGLELRVKPSELLGMVTFLTPADQQWQSSDASVGFDQWMCFELEVDTAAETEHVYVNDVEVTDLAQGNLALGQLGNVIVGLGFAQANPQPSYDVWIDEVAVDSARIGCTN
jgi:hypothetical protein